MDQSRSRLSNKKIGAGFTVNGSLLEIIKEQAELRRLDCVFVFHRDGRKVGDMRKSWANACRIAGMPGKLIHDFRRSTARNLTSLGIPQQVVMARCGWKTASTFRRYRIVDHADQVAANNAIDVARQAAGEAKIEVLKP